MALVSNTIVIPTVPFVQVSSRNRATLLTKTLFFLSLAFFSLGTIGQSSGMSGQLEAPRVGVSMGYPHVDLLGTVLSSRTDSKSRCVQKE